MKRLLSIIALSWAALFGESPPDLEQAKSDAAGALAYASLVHEQVVPTPAPTPPPVRAEQPVADAAAAAPAEASKVVTPAIARPTVVRPAIMRPVQPMQPVGRSTFGQPVYRIQAAPPGQPFYYCPSGNCGTRRFRW